MTDQELFDKVATHLFTQGKQATDPEGVCLYRAPDGSSCAAGCLIPDPLYDPRMEHEPANDLHGLGFTVPWTEDQNELVAALQRAHDALWNWRSSEHMHEKLTKVAATFDLTTANIQHLRLPDAEV